MSTLAIRFDFAVALRDDAAAARAVGEILARPAFAALERASARRGSRWSKHAAKTADIVAAYLLDREADSVYLDSKRGGELIASAEIENGLRNHDREPLAIRCFGFVAVPLDRSGWRAVVDGAVDLARILGVGAGMIAAEPTYALAHSFALGGSAPKPRPGLTQLRMRERRCRDWKRDQTAARLAGIEWGTFLGAAHLARVSVAALRAANVFADVREIGPGLAYVQLTADPDDDIRGELESRREAARIVLAPLLLELDDVS